MVQVRFPHTQIRVTPQKAAVVERLMERSPTTKSFRVRSPVGSLPDFRMWELCMADSVGARGKLKEEQLISDLATQQSDITALNNRILKLECSHEQANKNNSQVTLKIMKTKENMNEVIKEEGKNAEIKEWDWALAIISCRKGRYFTTETRQASYSVGRLRAVCSQQKSCAAAVRCNDVVTSTLRARENGQSSLQLAFAPLSGGSHGNTFDSALKSSNRLCRVARSMDAKLRRTSNITLELLGFINASGCPCNGGLMHVFVLMNGILNISFSADDKLSHIALGPRNEHRGRISLGVASRREALGTRRLLERDAGSRCVRRSQLEKGCACQRRSECRYRIPLPFPGAIENPPASWLINAGRTGPLDHHICGTEKLNEVRFPAGVAPGFSHVTFVPDDDGGLSRGSPISRALAFQRCSIVA
ncbi:hypothetical protein PR048_023067 [Dryococelus australis]|uniref:Uncharacterized protein n=1 Tax=Dryococelus australis TaxID=614101 RepID=A0ABQ9GT28_9NEOP|nr:hypothetical protein PR048_023067 [Dryococelus australis]